MRLIKETVVQAERPGVDDYQGTRIKYFFRSSYNSIPGVIGGIRYLTILLRDAFAPMEFFNISFSPFESADEFMYNQIA